MMAAGNDGKLDSPAAASAPGQNALAVADSLAARPFPAVALAGLVHAGELAGLILIGIAIRHLVGQDGGQGLSAAGWLGWAGILLAPLIATSLAHSGGCYRLAALRDPVRPLGKLLAIWTGVVILFAGIAFLGNLGSETAPRWMLATSIAGFLFLLVERLLLARLMGRFAREGRLDRRAVIIGAGDEAKALIETLAAESPDIRICGVFDDRSEERAPGAAGGLPRLGTIAEVVSFARKTHVDTVIVSLPQTAEQRLLEILRALWVLPVDIRLSAMSARLRFRPRAYSHIGSVPFLDLADRPIAGWDAVAKRSFDLVVAVIALILLSPIMLATALAIRLDSPGPILFRQKRYGFNNEVISVLKFRSMYHHLSDPNAKVVVTRGDPRVTRVGRFIRRASIDELPQLYSVLAGTLSIVGPRPHAVNAHTANQLWDEVVDGYFARHRVKPGITGWAQINGWRGEIDVPEKIQRRVEFDLEYIERWSVPFDLYIVLMTPLRLLTGENAY